MAEQKNTNSMNKNNNKNFDIDDLFNRNAVFLNEERQPHSNKSNHSISEKGYRVMLNRNLKLERILKIISLILVAFLLCGIFFAVSTLKLKKNNKALQNKMNSFNAERESYINDAKQQKENEEKLNKKIQELEQQLSAKRNGKPTESTHKTIYLTFDDGPSPNTPKILEILKKYDVKATFFVINTKYNGYLKDIVNEGHAIGLHSASHDYKTVYSSEGGFFDDFQKIEDVVFNETGQRPNIIRFPGGSSNTVSKKYCPGIMTLLTKKVHEKGWEYFDWNVSSGDADGNHVPVERIISNCKKLPKAAECNILMHDTAAKGTTVEALPTVIEFYKSQGYSFSVVTKDSYPAHQPILN